MSTEMVMDFLKELKYIQLELILNHIHTAAIGNFNNDHLADFVTANYRNGYTAVFLNKCY